MSQQPEALRLADALEKMPSYDFNKVYCEAAFQLRHLQRQLECLHAENEALKYKVAKSEVVQRRAVFEAVAKEREACAQTAMLIATNGIETSSAIRDREAHYVATT